MHFPFLHPVNNIVNEQPSVINQERESLSMEGSEFLDDALRMEDLSPRNDEYVATGNPPKTQTHRLTKLCPN